MSGLHGQWCYVCEWGTQSVKKVMSPSCSVGIRQCCCMQHRAPMMPPRPPTSKMYANIFNRSMQERVCVPVASGVWFSSLEFWLVGHLCFTKPPWQWLCHAAPVWFALQRQAGRAAMPSINILESG